MGCRAEVIRLSTRNCCKACIEKGYIIDTDIDAATFAMWGFVHGMASLIIRGRCAMMPDEAVKHILKGSLKFVNENIGANKNN